MSNPRSKSFNVLLSPEEHAQLSWIARGTRVSQGHVLRQSLAATYAMLRTGCPVCATGGRCMCPHLVQVEHPDLRAPELPSVAAPEVPQQ